MECNFKDGTLKTFKGIYNSVTSDEQNIITSFDPAHTV
jgi:hypothetical protein